MKKLVIFDLDGTLLNTISDLGVAANYALEKNGYSKYSLDSYPNFVGNGVRKLIERVLPVDERSASNIDKLLVDFKEYYSAHKTVNTTIYAGMKDLISKLVEMNIKVAVASNKYQSATEELIKYFFSDIEFTAVEGQKEGVPVKPDPSVVFSILAKADMPKADTLYVGDSGVDMETAWRACVDSVGVTWGFRSEKEIRGNHATFVVDNPDAIMDIVRGINLANYFNK